VGGQVINPVKFRKHIAYVMQDDALMATATPREALMFSANMRLPPTTDKKTLESLVDKLLDDLGLTECADVLIGGALIKGISGGQRKRTSVGVEVITDPAVSYDLRCKLLCSGSPQPSLVFPVPRSCCSWTSPHPA
jgi:ABC-type multidrug transport system ATPase subunit